MKITRLTQPITEPISLETAKQHLRVLHDFEDSLIQIYAAGARDTVEQFCERSFASAQFLASASKFCGTIKLPMDTTSVISVSYIDADGVAQTVDEDAFTFDPVTQLLKPVDSWPSGGKEPRISFWAGPDFDGSPAGVLPPIVLCVMLEYLGDLYENREAQVVGTIMTLNLRTQQMLWPFRTNLGM